MHADLKKNVYAILYESLRKKERKKGKKWRQNEGHPAEPEIFQRWVYKTESWGSAPKMWA